MQAFRTENNYRNASRLSAAELRAAMASREILQSTALAFDTQRQLRFELGGCRAVMPFGQCADGADTGSVRDIAVLTRVGRPTCFVIEGIDTDENGQTVYRLSRAEAQRMCKAEYLDQLQPGDILPCIVTHIEPFGAFCDVGCGISALLPIDCMSVSRISSPADRVSVGQQILCAIKSTGVDTVASIAARHIGDVMKLPNQSVVTLMGSGYTWLFVVYTILLFCAFVSTSVTLVYSMIQRFEGHCFPKAIKSKAARSVIVGLIVIGLCYAVSLLGLSTIISKIYGYDGYYALIVVVLPAFIWGIPKIKKLSAEKKAELSE